MTTPSQTIRPMALILCTLGTVALGAVSVAAATSADALRGGPARQDASGPAIIRVAANSAADACAKGLPADSKMIYDATVQNMKGPDSIRETATEQTKALVMAGKLNRDKARPAAEVAGNCLKLLAKS